MSTLIRSIEQQIAPEKLQTLVELFVTRMFAGSDQTQKILHSYVIIGALNFLDDTPNYLTRKDLENLGIVDPKPEDCLKKKLPDKISIAVTEGEVQEAFRAIEEKNIGYVFIDDVLTGKHYIRKK